MGIAKVNMANMKHELCELRLLKELHEQIIKSLDDELSVLNKKLAASALLAGTVPIIPSDYCQRLLPPVRDDLRDFEKAAGISIDVLCNVVGFSGFMIGRYIHGLNEWQVNGFGGNGFTKVSEWWYLPKAGSGVACNVL